MVLSLETLKIAIVCIFCWNLSRLVLHEISWNPKIKSTDASQSSISARPFSNFLSFLKISQPAGYYQQNGKHFCLLLLPFKINIKDASFQFFLFNLLIFLGLYLSQSRMLFEFFLTCTFHHLWKPLSLWCTNC